MSKIDNVDIFPWNISLETGIEIIDQQHKVIVNLINKVAKEVSYGTTKQEFQNEVKEVLKYTQYHFQTEEDIWKKYFPEDSSLKGHIHAHNNFVDRTLELVKKFETQELEQNIEDLLSLLTHWLTNHILDSDMRMSLTIKAIDSGSSFENAQKLVDEQMKGVMSIIIKSSLFLYDNLCANTLAYNREIRLLRKKETELKNKIEKQKLSKSNTLKELTSAFEGSSGDNKSCIAFLLIRIDSFIDIIESEGQVVVDELIKKITDSIKSTLHESEVLIRLSSSNFAIFYSDTNSKSPLEENAHQILAILSEPFIIKSNLARIYADIDTVIIPEGTNIKDELIMMSNNAIYSTISNRNYYNPTNTQELVETEIKLKKLTPRESDVLALIVKGKTNKYIARELKISMKTVEIHRSRVMKKMEAKTLADLVRITMFTQE